MNRHIFLAATEEGEKLDLTFDQEQNCKLVYKKSEDGIGYVFSGFWDERPETEYSDEYVIVPLRSVYDGTFSYTKQDVFANIIGSTGDHCPTSSWLQLLRDKGIPCSQCVTDGYFYDSRDHTGKTYFTDYKCGGGIKGGHMIREFDANSIAKGSHFYMIPICHNHNSCCTDSTGRNGSGFFMMPAVKGVGLKLKGYFTM